MKQLFLSVATCAAVLACTGAAYAATDIRYTLSIDLSPQAQAALDEASWDYWTVRAVPQSPYGSSLPAIPFVDVPAGATWNGDFATVFAQGLKYDLQLADVGNVRVRNFRFSQGDTTIYGDLSYGNDSLVDIRFDVPVFTTSTPITADSELPGWWVLRPPGTPAPSSFEVRAADLFLSSEVQDLLRDHYAEWLDIAQQNTPQMYSLLTGQTSLGKFSFVASSVPEPSSVLLAALGLAGAAAVARRRRGA